MNRDTVLAWAQSVGVEPGDEGFGIIVLAYGQGYTSALRRVIEECNTLHGAPTDFAPAWHQAIEAMYATVTSLIEKEPKP